MAFHCRSSAVVPAILERRETEDKSAFTYTRENKCAYIPTIVPQSGMRRAEEEPFRKPPTENVRAAWRVPRDAELHLL
jgi:hypothetical protein